MSEVRFPKRREDNSFCVEVTLAVHTVEPEELLRRVQDWSSRWMEANRVWEPQRDAENMGQLLYGQEFKTEPIPVSCTRTELKLRLEGQPSAERWRDWLVLRIIPGLKAAFTEIQDVSGMKDC